MATADFNFNAALNSLGGKFESSSSKGSVRDDNSIDGDNDDNINILMVLESDVNRISELCHAILNPFATDFFQIPSLQYTIHRYQL